MRKRGQSIVVMVPGGAVSVVIEQSMNRGRPLSSVVVDPSDLQEQSLAMDVRDHVVSVTWLDEDRVEAEGFAAHLHHPDFGPIQHRHDHHGHRH